MKKCVSLFLALALCLSLLPAALAVEVVEIVPPKYSDISYNVEYGLISVRRDGKKGLINAAGQEVIPCKYDSVHIISEDFVTVESDGKCGIIDTSGREITPCQYEDIGYRKGFDRFVAVKQDGKWTAIDVTGSDDMGDHFDGYIAAKKDGKWGYIDIATGKALTDFQYDDNSSFFSEGLAPVSADMGDTNKAGTPYMRFGYIDTTGELVIPFLYSTAMPFKNGIAQVRKGDNFTGRDGFIDRTGREIVPCKYSSARLVGNEVGQGLQRVYIGDVGQKSKYGLIDTVTKEEVVPCIYDSLRDMNEGFIKVWIDGSGYGILDGRGQEVLPCKYNKIGDFYNGFAEVLPDYGKLDPNYALIDKTGKVTPLPFARSERSIIGGDPQFSDGLFPVWEKYKGVGYINTDFQLVIPCQYAYAENFHNGFAVVQKCVGENQYLSAYIDTTGREITPFKYWSAGNFSDGLAQVTIDTGKIDYEKCTIITKSGFIDATGKEVIPLRYDEAGDFHNGVAPVELDGKWGLIDTTGKTVLPFQYDGIGYFDYGVGGLSYIVRKGKNGGLVRVLGDAYASTQSVLVDGAPVEFQCYALKDAAGNDTNYIKLRDVASVLNGTAAQFNVGWDGAVNIETGKAYAPNGSEMNTPFSGNRLYENAAAQTRIDGDAADLSAIVLKDDAGGAYTYYKLRDLGTALGFKVDWSAEKGIFIETK